MTMKLTALYIVGFAGQLASAFSWLNASPFSCPSNSNNVCNELQEAGWTFETLGLGIFDSYSSFSFDGFSCSTGLAKRSRVMPRNDQFSGNCITGSLSTSSGPSFSCGSSDAFSATQYYITVARDVDIIFEYDMGNGNTCSHTNSCSSKGTVVTNTQCGGALSVTFKLPDSESEGCDFGIWGVTFDCSSQGTSPSGSPSPPAASSPSSIAAVASSSPSASASPFPSPYASPVTSSFIPSPVVSSTPTSAVVGAQSSVPASSPLPTGSCPSIVPSCLNTWLSDVPNCKDNTDFDCFCQSSQFITDVYQCFAAWESDLLIVQAAVYWMAGICANYVGSNPAIITACPSSVTIGPVPTSTFIPQPSQILTTQYFTQTVTSCSAGQTVVASGVTTVVPSPTTIAVDVTLTTTVCPICTQSQSAIAQAVTTIVAGSTTYTVPQVVFLTTTISGSTAVSVINTVATSPTPAPTSKSTLPATVGSTATATYQPLQQTTNAAVGYLAGQSFGPMVAVLGLLAFAI